MKRYLILISFISSVLCLFGQEDRIYPESELVEANILSIYQWLYRDIPSVRFIYDEEELDSLNSHLFKVVAVPFSNVEWYWNRSKVRNKQDSIFGLKSRVIEKETEMLILDSISVAGHLFDSTINTTGNIIRAWGIYTTPTPSPFVREPRSTISHFSRFQISYYYIETQTIVRMLEDFFKIPVETKLYSHDRYDVEINIEKDYEEGVSDRIDTWLELLRKAGINLRLEKRVTKFVEIKKSQ